MPSFARRNVLLLWLVALVFGTAHTQSTRQQPKLLVTHAYLLTMAPDQRTPILGYITVAQNGRILAVAAGDPPPDLHAQTTFDAHGMWLLPGFISAHSHLWQSALRGLAADQTLTNWITAVYADHARRAAPEDFYWFTLDGALDHLQHGITTTYNFNYGGWREPQHVPASEADSYNGREFKAELESGIRFVHGIDLGFVSAPGATPAYDLAQARPPLAAFLAWTASQPRSDRFLAVMINGVTSFNNTVEQAVVEKALGDEFHLGNQSHYLEAPDTQWNDQTKFRWFLDTGLLDNRMIFGHFIHTTPFILEQAGKAGAAMSWNPLSNGRLASGVPDIPAYLKAGIHVGMGVDGEASADLADPFENMRTGLYAIRDKYQDGTVMSPYDVLRLATLGSAQALGVADTLGTLEPGKFADFLVVDPKRFRFITDPYASLVFIASERDLRRVYVGGDLKVNDGGLVGQNEDKVLSEVRTRVARLQ